MDLGEIGVLVEKRLVFVKALQARQRVCTEMAFAEWKDRRLFNEALFSSYEGMSEDRLMLLADDAFDATPLSSILVHNDNPYDIAIDNALYHDVVADTERASCWCGAPRSPPPTSPTSPR